MLVKHSPPLPKRNKKHTHRIITDSPSLEEILLDICNCFGQNTEMIKSKSQSTCHVVARRIFCYVAHVLTNESCHMISDLIKRDHTTYIDRVDQCIEWFEIKEPLFINEWDVYTLKSQIWNKYFFIKKSAKEEESSAYVQQIRSEERYWLRQIKQATAGKRKWRKLHKIALADNNTSKIDITRINIKKYLERISKAKNSLSSLKLTIKKAA